MRLRSSSADVLGGDRERQPEHVRHRPAPRSASGRRPGRPGLAISSAQRPPASTATRVASGQTSARWWLTSTRRASFGELRGQERPEPIGRGGVESGERLVQEEDARGGGAARGRSRPAAASPRLRCRTGVVGPRRRAPPRRARSAPPRRDPWQPVQPGREVEILARGQIVVEEGLVRKQADGTSRPRFANGSAGSPAPGPRRRWAASARPGSGAAWSCRRRWGRQRPAAPRRARRDRRRGAPAARRRRA